MKLFKKISNAWISVWDLSEEREKETACKSIASSVLTTSSASIPGYEIVKHIGFLHHKGEGRSDCVIDEFKLKAHKAGANAILNLTVGEKDASFGNVLLTKGVAALFPDVTVQGDAVLVEREQRVP